MFLVIRTNQKTKHQQVLSKFPKLEDAQFFLQKYATVLKKTHPGCKYDANKPEIKLNDFAIGLKKAK